MQTRWECVCTVHIYMYMELKRKGERFEKNLHIYETNEGDLYTHIAWGI